MAYFRDIALVGAGYWGKNLARNLNELGALHTLCDASTSVLESYSEGYEAVIKSTNSVSWLENPEVRKVVVATPAATHHQMVKAALLAGKDVMVEKPLCLHEEEGRELVRLAADRQRILMVGHLLQYHPCILKLRSIVAGGELGRLYYISSTRLNLGKIRKEENALWSFAPHDISVILSLTSDENPASVRCVGQANLTNGVADLTLTMLRFNGGIRAHIYVNWINPFKEQKLTVVGSEGMAVFDDTKPWDQKLLIHRNYLTWMDGQVPTPSKSCGQAVVVPQSEPLRNECIHFLECCNNRAVPQTDGQQGLRVLGVLAAAQRSLVRDGEEEAPSVEAQHHALDYFAHPTAIIDSGASIGKGCKIWHFTHVMSGASLGARCSLGQNVVVSQGVCLGNDVKVQNNVSIYTGVTCEDHVFLGPSCVFTNVTNPRSEISRKALYEKTLVRRGATIGANATIVCGVTLGRYCFIAAGAVVTKDVPDYALMVGSPARKVHWMSRHGQRLRRQLDGAYVCPESGLRYVESGPEVLKCIDLPEEGDLPAGTGFSKSTYDVYKSS